MMILIRLHIQAQQALQLNLLQPAGAKQKQVKQITIATTAETLDELSHIFTKCGQPTENRMSGSPRHLLNTSVLFSLLECSNQSHSPKARHQLCIESMRG